MRVQGCAYLPAPCRVEGHGQECARTHTLTHTHTHTHPPAPRAAPRIGDRGSTGIGGTGTGGTGQVGGDRARGQGEGTGCSGTHPSYSSTSSASDMAAPSLQKRKMSVWAKGGPDCLSSAPSSVRGPAWRPSQCPHPKGDLQPCCPDVTTGDPAKPPCTASFLTNACPWDDRLSERSPQVR